MANWSLLPADPLGFFELSPGFDRKDLKRSYGKLIKQFKPETHPAEFQRIREAYEVLESQNRYGVQQSQLQQAANAWASTFHAEAAVDSKSQPSSGPRSRANAPAHSNEDKGAWDDASKLPPQESYQRLKGQPSKSPQVYFMLATLSDLVEPRTANMYLKWLLTGVKEHPSDPGLLRLLTEYIAAFTEHSAAPGTLHTIAKLLAGDDFYRVTEPLWNRLIEEGDFDSFARTLDACERLLKHRSMRPRLAFYIHILRRAMWKAPSQWIEERLRFIEAHGSELGGGMDDEIDLLRGLHKYRQHDREAVVKTPVGDKIDKLIAAYCKGASAMNEVTTVCDELARNGNAWQQAFPAAKSEQHHDTLWLCMLILADVAQQTGVDFGRINTDRIQQQADAAVKDIVRTIEEISSRIFWMRARLYAFPFLFYWLGPLILTFGWSYWGLMLVIWTLLAGMSFAAIAVPFYFKKKADERTEKLIAREYEAIWRPRMFRYVQACHAPAQHSIPELQKSAHDIGHSGIVELVLAFAMGDRAMHLFNQLQLFLH